MCCDQKTLEDGIFWQNKQKNNHKTNRQIIQNISVFAYQYGVATYFFQIFWNLVSGIRIQIQYIFIIFLLFLVA